MTRLVWKVKGSLRDYVLGRAGGSIRAFDGAMDSEDGFMFPSVSAGEGSVRFGGTIVLSGHGGLMEIALGEPWLTRAHDTWLISLADPENSNERLNFASVGSFEPDAAGSLRGNGTALMAAGADLLLGSYREGEVLDDPVVSE